jgi:uncharacterized protein
VGIIEACGNMQFMLIARDYKDGGLERRKKVIEEHWKMGDKMRAEGKFLFGAGLLDEDNNMRGSVMLFNFQNRKELDEYLKTEPFVLAKVWESIEITPCKVRQELLDLSKK